MSKIKVSCNRHVKSKMRRNLRRAEGENIKTSRMSNSKKFGYSYKYYVKDEKNVFTMCEVNIPEHQEPITHIEHNKVLCKDENGRMYYTDTYEQVIDGYKTIPASTKMKRIYVGTEQIEPYLKRWSNSGNYKKFIKKTASKKVRRVPVDDELIGNLGSHYKKVFDVCWNLD